MRKFTLSVFTNYLIFRSEGFDVKDIKVNVGSDGSVTIGEDIRGTFLLLVPAIIKSKQLQKFIIKIIQKTINLYQKKELEVALVEKALNNNRFSFKKGLIKNQIRANEQSNL